MTAGAPAPVSALGGRPVGAGAPPLIVAELSGNHGGAFARARALIDAAHAAGADAIKLQTYTADSLTLDHDGPGFRLAGGLWAGRRLHELYREAATPWAWHAPLFAHARSLGLLAFSAPFDEAAVAQLEQLEVPAFKIASFELTEPALIARAARSGRPVILSTGMASLGEIETGLAALAAGGPAPALLLHCTSGYPTPPEDCDLNRIPTLARAFGLPVGLSDHSLGIAVPVAAVALGAVMIEKHLVLSHDAGDVDAAFSLDPAQFRAMAEACRTAWRALGSATVAVRPSEQGSRLYRRSLYAVADIPAGDRFRPETVRAIRPGHGLAPDLLPLVLTRCAAVAIPRGTPLTWDLIGGPARQ